jgi:hypothetical protein
MPPTTPPCPVPICLLPANTHFLGYSAKGQPHNQPASQPANQTTTTATKRRRRQSASQPSGENNAAAAVGGGGGPMPFGPIKLALCCCWPSGAVPTGRRPHPIQPPGPTKFQRQPAAVANATFGGQFLSPNSSPQFLCCCRQTISLSPAFLRRICPKSGRGSCCSTSQTTATGG